MSIKAWLLFIIFFLCSYFCFAQNWDIDLLKDINLHRDRSLDGFFRLVTNYAAPIAYSVPFFLFFYAVLKKLKVLKEKAVYILQSTFLALIVSTAIKHIVNRPRPFVTYPFIQKVATGASPSFPSGHTSDAFTLATSLSFAFPKWYVIIPAYSWAIAVGYSRMDLGVHYPSDVLGSIIIGIFCPFICYIIKRRKEKRALVAETNNNVNKTST